jgi:hypothetical protein
LGRSMFDGIIDRPKIAKGTLFFALLGDIDLIFGI